MWRGALSCSADWLTVHPPAFDRASSPSRSPRTPHRVWETGEFYETVRIETNAGDGGSAGAPDRAAAARLVFPGRRAGSCRCSPAPCCPRWRLRCSGHGSITRPFSGLPPCAAAASGLLALDAAARQHCRRHRHWGAYRLRRPDRRDGRRAGHVDAHIGRLRRAHRTGDGARDLWAAVLWAAWLLLQLLHLRKWKLWAFVVGRSACAWRRTAAGVGLKRYSPES